MLWRTFASERLIPWRRHFVSNPPRLRRELKSAAVHKQRSCGPLKLYAVASPVNPVIVQKPVRIVQQEARIFVGDFQIVGRLAVVLSVVLAARRVHAGWRVHAHGPVHDVNQVRAQSVNIPPA